jgi:pimeloyl-ACP methyl ester carboxylesterase
MMQKSPVTLPPAEVSDFASATCLVIFVASFIKMLVITFWAATIALRFRLMEYGYRLGGFQFGIATFHFSAAAVSSAYSRFRDWRLSRKGVGEISLHPVRTKLTTSISATAQKTTALIIIPGTWDKALSVPDGFQPLLSQLESLPHVPQVFIFKWPSFNSDQYRRRAASSLTELIKTEECATAKKIVLVGYSHGGTVACVAAQLLKVSREVTVITASSPVILTAWSRYSKDLQFAQKHFIAPNDFIVAQLKISDEARRSQYLLVRKMREELDKSLSMSKVSAIFRGLLILFVLSILPGILNIATFVALAKATYLFLRDMSQRSILWMTYWAIALAIMLLVRNPVVDNVNNMVRQLFVRLLFEPSSRLFQILFGVSYAQVRDNQLRLVKPHSEEMQITTVDEAGPLAVHGAVLGTSDFLDAVCAAVRPA